MYVLAMYWYSVLWRRVNIQVLTLHHITPSSFPKSTRGHSTYITRFTSQVHRHRVRFWPLSTLANRNLYKNFYDWHCSTANIEQLQLYFVLQHLQDMNPSRCKNVPQFLSSDHLLEKIFRYSLSVCRCIGRIAKSSY
jgi:hypothetical protein